jgi:hypothetical protein
MMALGHRLADHLTADAGSTLPIAKRSEKRDFYDNPIGPDGARIDRSGAGL